MYWIGMLLVAAGGIIIQIVLKKKEKDEDTSEREEYFKFTKSSPTDGMGHNDGYTKTTI